MDDALRNRLLALGRRDEETRTRLAAEGSLFDGYHPEMQTVHEANADALESIIAERGWPGRAIAGEDGAEAAWLIAQHAIARPALLRRALALIEAAAEHDEAPMAGRLSLRPHPRFRRPAAALRHQLRLG